MEEIVLNVKGMHCTGCENRIKNVLSEIDRVKDVQADHTTGIVKIETDAKVDIDEVKERIDDLGFEVE